MRKVPYHPNFSADLLYAGEKPRDGAIACIIGQHIKFDDDAMQCFVPDQWDPLIYDAMMLVAGVEICDHSKMRSKVDWARNLHLRLPVHQLERWQDPRVKLTLVRALKFLTGDNWSIEFRKTENPQSGPPQQSMDFQHSADMVIPYSDGLDSRAIAGIFKHEHGDELIKRVRIGSKRIKKPKPGEVVQLFENVPFKVKKVIRGNGESSGRSRGFKFGVLAGLAAYLIGAPKVIVPESGQGALGPVLVNVGQSHYDRRTHPQYTALMSDFLEALFEKRIAFEHPVIFGTKGQTLAAYKALYPDELIWDKTRSCWMDQRHASFNGEHRQCGICAACMLRRTSLHAAGYHERADKYLWEDLGAADFASGASPAFERRNNSQFEYAVAGTLHMDHLAALKNDPGLDMIVLRHAIPVARAMGLSVDETKAKIFGMIETHASEWAAFLDDLPKVSFVRNWAEAA